MSSRSKRLARTCAAFVSIGMVATGAAVVSAPATAQDSVNKRVVTDFAMNTSAFGTRLTTGIAELEAARLGWSNIACTRVANQRRSGEALMGLLPEEARDFITLDLMTTDTQTYRDGDVTGSRAVSNIGDIQVKVPNGPAVVLKGLVSTADSFHDASKNASNAFGTRTDFRFGGLGIDLGNMLPEEVNRPLQQLLDVIDSVAGETVRTVTNAVVEALATLNGGKPISIPGLGSIGLGTQMKNVQPGKSAASSTTALQIYLEPLDLTLDLGHAWSRIAANQGKAVFHGTSRLGTLNLVRSGDSALSILDRILMQTVACEGTGNGTNGKVVRKAKVDETLLGGLLQIKGGETTTMGRHLPNGGAVTRITSNIGSILVNGPVPVEVQGLTSVVKVTQRPDGTIMRTKRFPKRTFATSKVLKVLVDGKEVAPDRGVVRFDGGVVKVAPTVKGLSRGMSVAGALVTLEDFAPGELGRILELGLVDARIRRN